jgi:hypothetical protein
VFVALPLIALALGRLVVVVIFFLNVCKTHNKPI